MGIHMGGGSVVEANSAPRWGQMVADVRTRRKIRSQEGAGVCRAAALIRNVEAAARAVGIATAPAPPCERTGRGCLAMGKLCLHGIGTSAGRKRRHERRALGRRCFDPLQRTMASPINSHQ